MVVAPEVISVEEKKDGAAGLVADAARLFCSNSPRQEQARALRTGRSDQYPSFLVVERGVFDQFEA